MALAPDGMLRSFELRVQEQAQQLSVRTRKSALAVESPGGEVRVTVDSDGGLVGLRFGAAAERVSLDRLAELVVGMSLQAQGKLAQATAVPPKSGDGSAGTSAGIAVTRAGEPLAGAVPAESA